MDRDPDGLVWAFLPGGTDPSCRDCLAAEDLAETMSASKRAAVLVHTPVGERVPLGPGSSS